MIVGKLTGMKPYSKSCLMNCLDILRTQDRFATYCKQEDCSELDVELLEIDSYSFDVRLMNKAAIYSFAMSAH